MSGVDGFFNLWILHVPFPSVSENFMGKTAKIKNKIIIIILDRVYNAVKRIIILSC